MTDPDSDGSSGPGPGAAGADGDDGSEPGESGRAASTRAVHDDGVGPEESAATDTSDPTEPQFDESAGSGSEQSTDSAPGDSDSGEETRTDPRTERTRRWTAWVAAAVLLVGLGAAYGSPSIAAAALVPLAYVCYGALSRPPDPTQLRVERQIHDDRTTPGDPVTVETTVTATSVFGDVRVLDGVPDELRVTDGSPRVATPLRPGESVTVRYTVTARRGGFTFDPVRIRTRSVAGSVTATVDRPATGDDELSCSPPGAVVPVSRAAPQRIGTASADAGGDGVEFYATREYRRGDPVSRIDWRGYAKRGELTTTTYREDRQARAVVLLDVRPPTRHSARPGAPTGGALAAYTAESALAQLRAVGHDVSLAVLGLRPSAVERTVTTAGSAVWLRTAGGVAGGTRADAAVARRTRAVLAAAATAAGRRNTDAPGDARDHGDVTVAADQLAAVVPADADTVVVSPFLDGAPAVYSRRLAVAGASVTVLSPDATSDATLGGRTARIDRRLRLREIESVCAGVVDWPADRSLALAVARTLGGDRR